MVNYSLTELKGLAWLQYSEMTFPSYQTALQSLQFEDSIVAIGASIEQKPVGLGLARLYPEEKAAIISPSLLNPPIVVRVSAQPYSRI